MRAALLPQSLGRCLEHDPHRRADRSQQLELRSGHHSRVQVRQEPGLLEDEPRAAREVLERRLAAELAELVARDLVSELRLVPEREERLAAAGGGAGARDVQHLFFGHVRALAPPRRPREGAVAADVAAERRQRDEDLGRVGDEAPRAQPPGLREKLVERRGEEVYGVDHVTPNPRTSGTAARGVSR